jgi:hypothetical protein
MGLRIAGRPFDEETVFRLTMSYSTLAAVSPPKLAVRFSAENGGSSYAGSAQFTRRPRAQSDEAAKAVLSSSKTRSGAVAIGV